MRINRKDYVITCITFLLCVSCGNAFGQSATDSRRSPSYLSRETFEFPGGGQRNNNGYIGDFCCTGETATVLTVQQNPIGYIYFYDFPGGGLMCKVNGRSRSSAAQFAVLVSGISDPTQLDSRRVKSSINFGAPELKPGASRHIVAGALQFTATVLDVEFTDNAHSRYWMDSIRVKIDVQQVSDKENSNARPCLSSAVSMH